MKSKSLSEKLLDSVGFAVASVGFEPDDLSFAYSV